MIDNCEYVLAQIVPQPESLAKLMLQLSPQEWENLECQIGISNASVNASGNSSQTVMSGIN